MARPAMRVQGRRPVSAPPKKDREKQPRNWKKIGLWTVGILGFLVLLFSLVVFNPFEGDAREFTYYVPRNVDFFLLKKDLSDDLDDRDEPYFMPKLRDTRAWANFRRSGDYQEEIVQTGIETSVEDVVRALDEAPIDVFAGLLGREFIFAGRSHRDQDGKLVKPVEGVSFLKQADVAIYFRVTWKVKLAYRFLRSSMLRGWFASELPVENDGDHVVLEGLDGLDGVKLRIWRDRDLLVVTNSESFLREIQDLVDKEEEGSESFRLTGDFDLFQKEKAKDTEEGDSNAYWIVRPDGFLRGLGIPGPVPRPRDNPRSTQADRFLGQIISTTFTDSIVGYSRGRTNPLGVSPYQSGLRIRGSVAMKLVETDRGESAREDDDSPVSIELDRDRLFALQLDDELRVPSFTEDGQGRSIEMLAGLVPQDVAIWSYLAGDLRALFRMFERSFPPVGHPGEDWDRAIINEQFEIALEGGGTQPGYNPQVEADRNREMNEIPRLAMARARRENPSAPEATLERIAATIENRMRAALPRPILVDTAKKEPAFREVLEHLASILGKSRGRPGTTGADIAMGRAMFVLRRNDYGDLRAGLSEDQRKLIPAFYDGPRAADPTPAWAFVFWIDTGERERLEATMEKFMGNLPWVGDSKNLRVEMVKEGVGQWYLQEYWHPSIPGPGQIVTAVVPFLEEDGIERREAAERNRGRRRPSNKIEKTTLYMVGNHLRLIEDLGTAAVKAQEDRERQGPPRLRNQSTFRDMLRSEIDQPSNMFAYWNGEELAHLREMAVQGEARRQAEIEVDDPAVTLRLFGQGLRDLGIYDQVYQPGLPIERLWKLVPENLADQVDARIVELREQLVQSKVPKVIEQLNLRSAYPALFRSGLLSLRTVSGKPPKINFQLALLFDFKPRDS